MSDLMKVLVILATGSVLATLVMPGRLTPQIIKASGDALSKFAKTSQGRG